MKPGIPWSVKGIEQQARAAAKEAARQSGMTIGEWLNTVILDSADGDDLERRYRRPPYRPKPLPGAGQGEGEDVTLRLEEIAEQLHTIARHESDTAFARPLSPEDDNRLQAILERLDAHEQHANSAIGALELRLEEMSQKLSHAPEHTVPQRAEDVPGYLALEGALRNIIEHIEVSETRGRESMKALQERLVEVMDGGGGETASGPALGRLEDRVAELAERMGRAEAAQPNELSELYQTEQRLRSLVAEARQAAGSIAAGENLSELRLEVERIGASVAQGADHAVTDLDGRMSRIEADLKRQLGERDQAAQFEIAALGQRIAATEQRLEHLATIEKSVAELARSLKAGGGEASNGSGVSLELKALEDGLKAVRASAHMSDRRTQDTLQAVHETLEQIVARLADLEADDRPEDEEASEMLAPAPEPEQALALDEEPENAAAPDEVVGETEDAAALDSDPEGFIFPEDAASEDSEPQLSDEPRIEIPGSTALDDHPPAEPAMDDYPPAAPSDTPLREDYIAAARRAAQMAASRNSGFNRFSQRMSGSSAKTATSADGRAQKRGFVSSLLAGLRGRKAKPQDAAPEDGKKSKRKRLILAGLVLLAAVAAYGAQRQASSLPGISLLGNFLVPETMSEAETRTGVHPHDALATGSIAPVASGKAESGASEATTASIGPQSLLKAAIAGDPTAQFVVAGRYLEGRAVARDERLAAQWYGRAAKQGLAAAQYRLGSMYEHGRGVAVDREQAKSWYEQAAELGNINAMHNLAVLHADAGSGNRNYSLAAKWFHKAAERGLKDSQFNLAVLSEQGLGVARNPQDAVFWYSLAAVQGDSEAAAKAKAIEAMLADDLAKQVHARLLAWRPLSADRNANVVPVGDPSWLETS